MVFNTIVGLDVLPAALRLNLRPGALLSHSQRGTPRHTPPGRKRSEASQHDCAAKDGGASVPRNLCELGVLGSSHSTALCSQRGSGWLSFSFLKSAVLRSAISRRGRLPLVTLRPGASRSAWLAPSRPRPIPPPLRRLRN
ncbi:hypothetical protein NDU88_011316 [Pleurodeles waltl]|uniref:Uncharacterized protein n=1 Tax=Pleurodeles waltl TaxID=8319 RepID=A0AAV7S6J2_PLEWA|nr:hypothetical protein NDU88_011316 [Pleurodeles waltl]